MGEFDYQMPVAALPQRTVDLGALFGSITSMEDEEAKFVGGIYGPAGGGKTVGAMELANIITPPDKRILFNYTGHNWNSLKNHSHLMGPRVGKRPFENMDDLAALVAALKNPAVREQTKIGTMVFDEYNTMFDMDVAAITRTRSAQLLEGKPSKYKDPDTPEWPDYNSAKAHMINMMNDMLQVPEINFIFVCHPREQSKTFVTEPDFFPKASQEFIRSLNSLYHLSRTNVNGNVVRRVILQGDDRLVAKNRIGGLPDIIDGDGAMHMIANAFNAWAPGKKNSPPVEEKKPVPVADPPMPAQEPVSNPVQEQAIVSPVESVPVPVVEEKVATFDLDAFLSA
jgi:hypothetical protein